MSVFLIADLHLGHTNMAIKRGFKDAEEHDNIIISKWNSVVTKRDIVYVLGDITMETSKHYHKLGLLNGDKIFVLGNHDLLKDITKLQEYGRVTAVIKYKQKGYKSAFLTHIPIHPMELDYRVSLNIHGHLHEGSVMKDGEKDSRYICVSCEHIDYTPIEYKKLIAQNLERGQVDLRKCSKGDRLLSAHGQIITYIAPIADNDYYDHKVEIHTDGIKGYGSRTHDGYVFRKNRLPDTDHDIVKILK